MSIRSDFEEREKDFMSPYGCLSSDIRGREREEQPSNIRTEFQIDRERIVYSNAFRRLKHKTQVFLSPLGDQYRTRLTHTLEVAQISRTIARAMRLNEDLAEAIALGHDLGHTPFGHSGETVLNSISPSGFAHNEQSIRVVEKLENNGMGLNLTFEVRDGILKHSKGYGNIIDDDPREMAVTLEGRIVRVADIMAYLNHDLDDAIRCRVISHSDVPDICIKILGKTHSDRAATMIRDLVYSSVESGGEIQLRLSDIIFEAMTELRRFLYEKVYRSPKVHSEFEKANRILNELYNFFYTHTDMLESELVRMEMGNCFTPEAGIDRVVCDFIASITDEYALELYSRLFFPTPII